MANISQINGLLIDAATASFTVSASYTTTASYAVTAQSVLGSITSAATASYLNPGTYTVTASWAISASSVVTASYVTGSIFTGANRVASASYAVTAETASYSTTLGATLAQSANNQVSLRSSNGTTLSTLTINNITSASYAETASYSTTLGAAIGQNAAGTIQLRNSAGTAISSINVNTLTASLAYTASYLNPGTYAITSSWATNVVTASYVTGSMFTSTNPALSASYALTASYAAVANALLGSVTSAATASYLNPGTYVVTASWAQSASQAITASYINPTFISASAAASGFGSGGGNSTPTFPYTGSAIISGSAIITGSTSIKGDTEIAGNLLVSGALPFGGGIIDTGGSELRDFSDKYSVRWGSRQLGNDEETAVLVWGSGTDYYMSDANNNVSIWWSKRRLTSGSSTTVLDWSSGTGSLVGTSSWATNAITSSYSRTSSFLNPGTYLITASWAQSSSNAITASYVTGSIHTSTNPALSASYALSSSYAINSSTASFLPLGTYAVTSSWAQSASNATTASYVTGSVHTSTNPALSASYALTASYALSGGSGATFPFNGNAVITGSLLVSGSNSGLSGITGSLQGTASYVTGSIHTSTNPALSASYALSSSYALNSSTASFLSAGTYAITSSWAQSSSQATSASFATTASFVISSSYALSSSLAATASYATGSIFTGANRAASASYALSSSYAINSSTASFLPLGTYAVTSSWAQSASQALTASFISAGTYAITSSWAQSASIAITASYVTGSIHTSANPALSASYALSSSFATSASYAPTAPTFPFTGSAVITGSLWVRTSGANTQGGLNTSASTLIDSALTPSLNWGIRQAYPGASVIPVLDWGVGQLSDDNGFKSVDWQLRTLYYPDGTTPALDYGTQNQITMSGSVSSLNGYTGSLFGTASQATTASYALNGGVTSIVAGTNVTISPTNGLGAVTINSTGGSGGSSGPLSAVQVFRTSSYQLTTTFVNLTFTTASVQNAPTVVSHSVSSRERIYIGETGLYQISYNASAGVIPSNLTGGINDYEFRLVKNGTLYISASLVNGRNSSTDVGAASATVLTELSANDYITLQARISGSTAQTPFVYESASLNVVKLEGLTGPSGSAGASFPYTGSAIISGSLSITGSVNSLGGFTGSLQGTASYITGSIFTGANQVASASYINPTFISASAAASGFGSGGGSSTPTFPYTGSAIISGSLIVTGSVVARLGGFTGSFSGSIAAPGNTGEVLYNNAGIVAAATNVEIESGNLRLVSTTDPATPTGALILYDKVVGGRHLPKMIGPSGVDTTLQTGLSGNSITIIVPANGTTLPTIIGGVLQNNTGTTSHQQTIASSAPWQATRRTRFITAATINTVTGIRTPYGQWFRGSATGFGGFWFRAQLGQSVNVTGGQKFVGLCASTAALAGDPSALLNMCGMGYDSADTAATNWFFMYNDGTGAATKVDLNGGAPSLVAAPRDTTTGYDLIMYMAPGGSELFVRIINLVTNAVIMDTSFTSLLPTANTALAFKAETRTTAATANDIEIAKVYIESDY